MVMAKDIFHRVADEARPPAVLGRYPGMPDYFPEVLLNDLVESGAWLDLELKRPFLALWVNDESFDDPDLDDPWPEELPHVKVERIVVFDREYINKVNGSTGLSYMPW